MKNKLSQVILFQDDEVALNYRYKLPYQLNTSIQVKSIDYDVEDFINSGAKLVGPRPNNDSIYYLHPYKDNEYVHESLGEMYFLKEKFNLYRRIGALLGAKTISTKVKLIKSESVEIDFEGNIQVKLVNAGLNGNLTKESTYGQFELIKDKINQEDNFDLDRNIDKLKVMIDQFNLHHELDLVSLIEDRDSREWGTKIGYRKIESEISSEFSRLLKASAQISSPVFSVGADFKNSLKSINKLMVDIVFDFDN